MKGSFKERNAHHSIVSGENEVTLLQEQCLPVPMVAEGVTYDAIVLDAALRQSLLTTRSLGRRGKHVAALETRSVLVRSTHIPTFASRWCQKATLLPGYERDQEPFFTALKQEVAATGARVLISAADGTIEVLRRHRAELEGMGVRLALANEAALAIAIKKDATLALAEQVGVPVPRGVLLSAESELEAALHEIGLPAVVKPTQSWRWGPEQGIRLTCKLVITVEEAHREVQRFLREGSKVFLQQFLSGHQESISLFYTRGEMYARFAQRTIRSHPPLGGVSTYRQSIPLPADITDYAERLVRAIGLEGYAQVQFRRDHAGRPYLMEINPRLTSGLELAVRAGIDFPWLVYQWACDEPLTRVAGYRAGLRMRYLEGDFLTTVQTLVERGRPGVMPPSSAIREFIAAFFIPTGYDYFDWQDTRPAWAAACETIDHVWYRLKREIRARRHRQQERN